MSDTPTHPQPTLAPFDPAEFERRLWIDDAIRRTIYGISFALFAFALITPFVVAVQHQHLASLAVVVALPILWVWLSLSTTSVARMLPEIGTNITADPQRAEALIATALDKKPVMRWARMLTYHRLAAMRHHQRRFAETASLCEHVLNQPLLGPAASARPSLLLMLTEAHLAQNNLAGAYHALDELHRTRLGLAGAIQRLALQTRYALKAGHYEHALEHGRQKIELAELMPQPQCTAMHAMLATAAQKAGRERLAQWLWERAKLLSPPGLLDQLAQGAFDIEVVAGEEDATDLAT